MTIQSEINKAGPFDGNDSTTVFPFTFKLFVAADLGVYLTDTNDIDTELVLDTDYSVSLNADQEASPGGSVTYPASGSPLATGEKLTLINEASLLQGVDLQNGGAWNPQTVEDAMDLATMLVQRVKEQSDRSAKAPVSDDGTTDHTLPVYEAGQAIIWDPLLKKFVNGSAPSFLEPPFAIFTTVAAMKLANIPVGRTAITQGYYDAGDGGGASYLSEVLNSPDGLGDHALSGGASQATLQVAGAVNVKQYGAKGDGATDDRLAIQTAINTCKNVFIPADTYYVSGTGINITVGGVHIEGEAGAFLKCERTYYVEDSPSAGDHTVGQGNIFYGGSLDNITIKSLTIIGAYDTAWGDEGHAGKVPDTAGSHLIFFNACTNVNLIDFNIKNSYASEIALTTLTYEQMLTDIHGWHQILLTGCTGVKLDGCNWFESAGESWFIYNCTNVIVEGCTFVNDYGVSQLDVTYCNYVTITGNQFKKLLASDSGQLLNVASAKVTITGNNFLNGDIDIGNEHLNASITLGLTFQLSDTIVDSNTLLNGHIAMSTSSGTSSLTWVQENVVVSNNSITCDLDTRPAADGFTALNYSGVVLPHYHSARNITVIGNTILLKGALQTTGANPHLYNRIRLIDCMVYSKDSYVRKGISIIGNSLITDLSNYDPDDINDDSGAIIIEYGDWEDLLISNNLIDSEMGILINEFESITRLAIHGNAMRSEFFLNMPATAPTTFDINGMEVSDNRFEFINTVGHTYTTTEVDEKGFGAFINMWVSADSDVNSMDVKNNKSESVIFALISNFTATTHNHVELDIESNTVTFVAFGAGTPTIYPLYLGRGTAEAPTSSIKINNNYFSEVSASTIAAVVNHAKTFDLISNRFIGNYTLTSTVTGLSGIPTSRFSFLNNLADNALTTTFGNTLTAVVKAINGNNEYFSYNGGATVNDEGDTYFSDNLTVDPWGDSSGTGDIKIQRDQGAYDNCIALSSDQANGYSLMYLNQIGGGAGNRYIGFNENGSQEGSITNTGAAGVAYNVTSDYRVKENVVALTDALNRLAQLKPSRFNFISRPGKTVDGFIAHEIQEVIPEAVAGEKDAIEDIGNILDISGEILHGEVAEPTTMLAGHTWIKTGTQPIYQGIDQAKIVPLLTAALIELAEKVKLLEDK